MDHKGTVVLETERLILRPFIMEDAQAVFDNWASDDEVTKFLVWPTHPSVLTTRLVLKDWIQQYERLDFYQWAIVLKESGEEPIGSISVVSQDASVEKAQIGYCLGKAWWHRGIMSESLNAVMDYLFRQVGMNRLEARHDPRNLHSGDVMRKCGMQYEGTMRCSDRNNQGICDTSWYGILKEDWLRNRA